MRTKQTMAKRLLRSSMGLFLSTTMALPATPLLAAEGHGQASNALTAIDVQEATQTTVITVRGLAAPTFTTFRLDKPSRLFVDVAGSDVQGLEAPKYVGNGVVRSVEVQSTRKSGAPVGRIVVTFEQDALYHVRADGNAVVVVVDGSDRKLNQAQSAQVAANEQAVKTAAAREKQLADELRATRAREEQAALASKQAQEERNRLADELARAKTDLQAQESLKKRLAEAEQAAQAAAARLAGEQKAADALRAELNKERASLQAVVAQRQSEEARVELLRQQIAALQKQEGTARDERLAVLQAELEKAKQQAEQLRDEMRRASESRRQAQAEEVEHLKKILAEKDRDLQAARASSNAEAKRKQEQLAGELAAARSRLMDTENALEKAKRADYEREQAER
ncbi:MAG: AMIN domain-containing protein, partial [Deltaproteobacteria bacterium]|nr:AMIN domain-containing protein [Deltaproteobacteria bacterium]